MPNVKVRVKNGDPVIPGWNHCPGNAKVIGVREVRCGRVDGDDDGDGLTLCS